MGAVVTETHAETLRRAAALMREQHGPEHVRHRFWHTLADWLDVAAEALPGAVLIHALRIARAYLGETEP